MEPTNPKTTISKLTAEMLTIWAKKRGAALLGQFEAKKLKETLALDWPKTKGNWLGGFVSGVICGFTLGMETSNKFKAKSAGEDDEGGEEKESQDSEESPEAEYNPDQMEFAL